MFWLGGIIAATVATSTSMAVDASPAAKHYPFELYPLPYPTNALEPAISKLTVETHHGKHVEGYRTKLNALLKNDEKYQNKSLDDIVSATKSGALFNNAAQFWNHFYYFQSMTPRTDNNAAIPEPLNGLIVKTFKEVKSFKAEYKDRCLGHFGSGWVWLIWNAERAALEIMETHDAANPLSARGILHPLLATDVWEHSYYLDYKNDRGAHIENWFNIVNWEFANEQLKKAQTSGPSSRCATPGDKSIFSSWSAALAMTIGCSV